MSKERLYLINLRKNKKLSQEKVAKLLNITGSYYGMIEQGVRTPSLALAQKISSFFGKSMEEIFFNNQNNSVL